jgi:RNA polymerase sigma-70 factor, ECF subfamily
VVNQHQITEEEAVHLLSSRSIAGMEMIYDRYASAIYGIIHRIVQNETVAEELLQEVCLKIWNSHSQYKASGERLFPWIVRLARNAAVDKIKSREYAGSARSHNDKVHAVAAVVPTNAALDQQHREILDLMFFGGHTQIEVALKLHIPLSAVKARARAAILALRKSS